MVCPFKNNRALDFCYVGFDIARNSYWKLVNNIRRYEQDCKENCPKYKNCLEWKHENK